MRYELTDFEWTAIRPFLPNKPRGLPRVNDRRVLNGIFWILRSGARESFGPYTTCYNRFVRWRMAGIWDLIMEALAETYDGSVQMIDTSIVRVRARNLVERFFNRIKQCRRVATRYDKLAANS
jgi:transposase